MDGREAMSPFYLHRAIGAPPGLHRSPGFGQMPNQNPSQPANHSGGSGPIGSAFKVESSSSAYPHGVNVGGGLAGLCVSGEPVKRKRGRPRKYGPGADGTVSLALTPMPSIPPGSASVTGTVAGLVSGSESFAPAQKRGRGRPPGTGRKQQLASLGEWVCDSAGMGFTPHAILIPIGEDIAAKIMSFSQQGPRAVCILSASGAVSRVTLRQPAASGGSVTYEGCFEILSLSGSYLLTDDGGSRSRSGGLSISLSSPDGRVIGGGVGGFLIAASTVQVIVGSFIYGGAKAKNKSKASQEPAVDSEPPVGDKQGTHSSTLPNQSFGPSSLMGGWLGSRQIGIRNPDIGIDLTQG